MLTLLVAVMLQSPPAQDLSLLEGRWSGTLTYLDYKDNKTHVTLQTTLDATRTANELRYRFSYVEPNGKPVTGDETLVVASADGRSIRIGSDEWTITSSAAGRVVLEREGIDAGRPARFSRSYMIAGDELRIQTTATPAGGDPPVVRNTYVLRRIR